MNLDDFCREVEKRLQAAERIEDKLSVAADALRMAFRVRPDEVSIFGYSPHRQVLHFLWPRHLKQAGIVPLAARQSLVSRTLKENRAFLDNRFSSSSHLSIFEIVPESKGGGVPLPIQKIISAPIGKEPQGVVQVCRKGETADKAGPDFTQSELRALAHLAVILGRHLEIGGPDGAGE